MPMEKRDPIFHDGRCSGPSWARYRVVVVVVWAMTCLSVLSAEPARADLAFRQRQVIVDARPTDEKVKAVFTFRVSGTKPVRIKRIATTCGCTRATTDRDEYKPGQAGRLNAEFEVGGRTGTQRKKIIVTTDDPRDRPATVTLVVNIPMLLRCQPRLVYWRTDQPAEPKTIDVDVVHDDPIEVTNVITNSPRLEATLKVIEKGRKYQVTVQPTDTDEALSAKIGLQTDFPPAVPRTYVLYARVIAPKPAPDDAENGDSDGTTERGDDDPDDAGEKPPKKDRPDDPTGNSGAESEADEAGDSAEPG